MHIQYSKRSGSFLIRFSVGSAPLRNWTIVKSGMKKKPLAEPVISSEILELAKKSTESERAQSNEICAVCGAATVPLTGPQNNAEEDLCWVCRRLKISAWRETDQQATVQE